MSVLRFRSLGPLACALSWPTLLLFQGCFFSLGGENETAPDRSLSGYYGFSFPLPSARLDLDSSYPVRWSVSGAAGNGPVRLSVFRGNVFLGNLSTSLASEEGYTWSLPATRSLGDYRLGSGSGYRLRLANIADSARQGFSDSFSIVSRYSGTLALTAPGPGSRARIDSALTLSWSAAGRIGGTVGLQLFKDAVLVRLIADSIPAEAGSYVWPSVSVPAGPGNGYRIRIFAESDPSIDRTGGAFVLASAASDTSTRGIDPDIYESDDSLASAKTIGTDGASQRRTLPAGDVDLIRFNTAPGKFYRIGLAAEKELELDVEDSSGNDLLDQRGNDIHFIFAPVHPGPHYLRVYSASPAGAGAYQLTVTGYDSSATYKAAFSAPDSNVVWKAGSDQTILWAPDSVVFGPSITLLLFHDTSFVRTVGNYLPNSGIFAWTLPSDLPGGNRYRIRISSMASNSISAFSSAFAIDGLPPDAYEPDDGPETAKDILVNATAQQRSFLAGEADWCRFEASAGMRYTATVEFSGLSIALSMRDSSGAEVAADTSNSGTLTYAARYNGSYYLEVLGQAGAGNYSLKLEGLP
jgi:hypothetical protein